ncbi:MAG: putative baseplate assembly protein [Candidatus Thiodiazotropha sp.]
MKDPTCGCCEGTETLTPLATANRPGLDALSYRVGTHGSFFESMVARLTSHRLADGRRPLRGLQSRQPDDPSLALLDAWSSVADVLTFYQERIANEGYLMTATERRSILELARLVGYRLRPGVSASVFLAFTLEEDFELEIPAGTLARSLPGPGELPQPFETDEPLQARSAWNAISPRLSRPLYLQREIGFTEARDLYLDGVATDLKVNDALVIVQGNEATAYTAQAVETDASADLTTLSYLPYGTAPPLPGSSPTPHSGSLDPPLTRLAEVVRGLRKAPSLQPPNRFQLARSAALAYGASADLGPRLLTRFSPRLQQTLYTAYANAPVTGIAAEELPQVEAFRLKISPFGHNAPPDLVYADNVLVGRREWDLAEFKSSLGLRLSATTQSLDSVFDLDVDLGNGLFPPLELQLFVSDGINNLEEVVTLDQLDQTFSDSTQSTYEGSFAIQGSYVSVTVRAGYSGVLSSSNLRAIEATFTEASQQRSILIREPSSVGVVLATVVTPTSFFDVEVNGMSAIPIGNGQTVSQPVPETNQHVSLSFNSAGDQLQAGLDDSNFVVSDTTLSLLSLDATYDDIRVGSWLLLDRPDSDPQLYRVLQVNTLSRVDYGISAKVTQLLLDRPWLEQSDSSLSLLRATTVFAQSEIQALAEAPMVEDVAGGEIELGALHEALEAGRWVAVSGERTDVLDENQQIVEGIEASELAMLAGVEHRVQTVTDVNGNLLELPGDTLHTRLLLAEDLAYRYRRDSVKINANLVKASHGETQREILGSGNAAQAMQTFTLGNSPLTHTAAPTPEGVESSLEVRVNDILWPEEKTLLYLDGTQRGYQTKRDNEGNTSTIFGDGKRGARLPTGVENVSAVYRAGIGKAGNVAAGRISILGSPPLGVKEVTNPQIASGGADAESRDQARRNAPLAVLALDRLVSVEDYASFTRTYAGIGKAHAVSLSDGHRNLIHLTIAGADDQPIEPQSDLYRNLLRSLDRFGDPHLPLQLALREALFLFINARVRIHEAYLWEKVEPAIRGALLDRFSFEGRELGEDLLLSGVIAVIQGVEGVDYVDVDLFDAVSEAEAEDPQVLAQRLADLAASQRGASAGGGVCDAFAQPKHYIPVDLARLDPLLGIRPAQLAYLNPELPDTLILTEATS